MKREAGAELLALTSLHSFLLSSLTVAAAAAAAARHRRSSYGLASSMEIVDAAASRPLLPFQRGGDRVRLWPPQVHRSTSVTSPSPFPPLSLMQRKRFSFSSVKATVRPCSEIIQKSFRTTQQYGVLM
jgi:hypothetical protein